MSKHCAASFGYVACLLAATLLVGCSVTPTPITREELQVVNIADRTRSMDLVPVIEPLTLNEAAARALKFNLDNRTLMLEQSLSKARFQAGKFDLLPKLQAGAGYTDRDRFIIRDAVDSVTGLPSLSNPFITSENERMTADLGLTWNLLDFGVSYYNAKQNADRFLIAKQRRRQAMHELIQKTYAAFWRALAAQKLHESVVSNRLSAERALAASRAELAKGIRAPGQALRYQRSLIENLRILESVESELMAARIELSKLIGVTPAQQYELVEPEGVRSNILGLTAEQMEEMALVNNPGLIEEHYNARVVALEARKSLLQILPNFSLDYGSYYDSDEFLINDYWREGGMRVTYNLMNIFSAPSRRRAAASASAVAESRRAAMQMAVLTQVHLGRNYYASVLRQYERAKQLASLDDALSGLAGKEYVQGVSSELDQISASVVAIMSDVRQYQAIARVEEAASKIQATLGLQPSFGSVDEISVPELARVLETAFSNELSLDGTE